MTTRLQFPLDPAAVRKADEAFYARHPEMVEGGRRRKLTANDPAEAPLREEWRQLYGQSGGATHQPPAPGPKAAAEHDRMRDSVDKGFSRVRPVVETVQHCAIPAAASTLPVQYDRPCNLTELVVTEHRKEPRIVRYIPDPVPSKMGPMVLPPGGVFAIIGGGAGEGYETSVSFTAKGSGFCGGATHPAIDIKGFPVAPGKSDRTVSVQSRELPGGIEGGTHALATAIAMLDNSKSYTFSANSCGLPPGQADPVSTINGTLVVYPPDKFTLTLKSNSVQGEKYDSRNERGFEDNKDTCELKLEHFRGAGITTVDYAKYIKMVKKIAEEIKDIGAIFRRYDWAPGPRFQCSIALINGNFEAEWGYVEPEDKAQVDLVTKGKVFVNIIQGELIFSLIVTPYPFTKLEIGVKFAGELGFKREFEIRTQRPDADAHISGNIFKPHGKFEVTAFVEGQVGFVKAALEGNAEFVADIELHINNKDKPFYLKAENGHFKDISAKGYVDIWIGEVGFKKKLWDRYDLFKTLSFPSSN
jgi:hypothetical protein